MIRNDITALGNKLAIFYINFAVLERDFDIIINSERTAIKRLIYNIGIGIRSITASDERDISICYNAIRNLYPLSRLNNLQLAVIDIPINFAGR